MTALQLSSRVRSTPAPQQAPPPTSQISMRPGGQPLPHAGHYQASLPVTIGATALATRAAGEGKHSDLDIEEFGPQPTSTVELPDAHAWATKVGQAVLEVINGARKPAQVVRWTAPAVHESIARRYTLAVRRTRTNQRIVIRRTLVCEPADGVAEATLIVIDGPRVRAIAMRMRGWDGRWVVEALQIG